jgi:plasmid maintenance system antidote protein VapI
MKSYRIPVTTCDPTLSIQLPAEIIKDLVLRSEENGRSIGIEIALRLARSLERDQNMLKNDNTLAELAFSKVSALFK